MPGIVRQSDQYAIFDTETRYPKEREARVVPADVVAEYTRGRSVGTGMLNPGNRRHGVDVHGLDPNEHAYATEDYPGPGPGRHFDPNTGYQLSPEDERRMEMVGEDDASGYNWGPAPHPGDPGPGLHPDFHDGTPHPFGTPVYHPGGGYGNHLGSRLGFTH